MIIGTNRVDSSWDALDITWLNQATEKLRWFVNIYLKRGFGCQLYEPCGFSGELTNAALFQCIYWYLQSVLFPGILPLLYSVADKKLTLLFLISRHTHITKGNISIHCLKHHIAYNIVVNDIRLKILIYQL